MSYTIVNQGGTIDALLKNGVPVAVLDSAAANDPIVLDDAFVPADKAVLVDTWAKQFNYDDYIKGLYDQEKQTHDQSEQAALEADSDYTVVEFETFEAWTVPISDVSFVVEQMKKILASQTNKYYRNLQQKLINELV